MINSPGGSPVQAGQIFDEMRRLRAKHPDKPTYAVVEELAASGGYYIAAGADRIYVDKASIVGSIGVIMDGFGAQARIEKLGIERRVHHGRREQVVPRSVPAAGPEARAARPHDARRRARAVHRGGARRAAATRLKETPELFSGLVWTGQRAIELGLADEIGSVDYVAREVIKAQEIVDFTPEERLTERLARRFGTDVRADDRATSCAFPGSAGYTLRWT